MNKKVLLLIVCLVICVEAFSQVIYQKDTVECSVYFHQGKSFFDPDFKGNDNRLKQFVNEAYFREGDPTMSIKRILVSSGASPEGPHAVNERLSKDRAAAIINFLKEHTDLSDSSIIVHSSGVDWEGLAALVKNSDEVPDKDSVLAIINSKEYGSDDIARRKAIETFREGRAYRWMYGNLFPYLRHSSVSIAYLRISGVETPRLPAPVLPQSVSAEDIIAGVPKPIVRPALALREKKMIMAARTNLLIPGCNVGLEFPIKDNWSIGIDYFYPWAVSKKNKWCCEMLGLFIDGKYWFTGEKYKWTKSERLQGHAVGIYAGIGYYDFQKIDRGAQGEYVDVGVDYTFGLPIANGKLRMEFNLGIGWIRTYYRSYYPSSDFNDLIKDPGIIQRSTSFFGPSRASVSFLVPIRINKKIRF